MNYVRGAFSAVSNYYGTINPATLTGAIDVIVVERPAQGGSTELVCTPFHVRFGKFQAFRPTDRQVTVLVNGQRIPYFMKIGDAGEAFFVFETDEDVPRELITSPILGAQPDPEAQRQHAAAGRFGAAESSSDVAEGTTENKMPEPTFLDLDNGSDPTPPSTPPNGSENTLPDASSNPAPVEQPGILSKTASVVSVAKTAITTAPNAAVNQLKRLQDKVRTVESEADEGDRALEGMDREAGQPPDVTYRKDIVLDMGGYHNAAADGEGSDEEHHALEERRIRFSDKTPRPAKLEFAPLDSPVNDDTELDQRTSRPLDIDRTPRPSFVEPMSPPLDGLTELRRSNSSPGPATENDLAPEPETAKLTTSQSSATIKALVFPTSNGAALPGYIRGGSAPPDLGETPPTISLSEPSTSPPHPEYSWEWGGFPTRSPISTTRKFPDIPGATSLDDIDAEAQKHLAKEKEAKEASKANLNATVPSRKLLLPSSRSDGNITSPDTSPRLAPTMASSISVDKRASGSTWTRWWSRNRVEPPVSGPMRPELKPVSSAPTELTSEIGEAVGSITPSAPASIPLPSSPPFDATEPGKRYAKTLRLTSDQLKALALKKGANTITFSLSATGVAACTAKIFLWDHTESVVVSDIDGTITKSDALGHMFNLIGRDWTHLGVAKLFTDITRNGYKIMYLTSRAIGQADTTRDYLKGIRQNNYQLPEGPVIMSPDRLMASFHREVIMRKPEVFKMACLRDIQRLFCDANKHPFYAGFGNRITDALSYRSVNVPSARIFTIDSSGDVKLELLELAGYKSSYIHMTDLVDQMFPPIHRKWATEFTDFNYWRDPLPEIELPDLDPPSPALSAVSDSSNVGRLTRLRNFSLLGGSSPKNMSAVEDAVTRAIRQRSPLGRSDDGHSATLVDAGEMELRRKLSFESLPGSMPGSESDYGGDEDEDEEGLEEDEGVEGEDEDEEIEEEPVFDEGDILATREMNNVPFI